MSDSPSSPWWDRSIMSLDRRSTYLRIFCTSIFVRDQDRSLQFYLDQLGFNLGVDNRFEGGGRWVAVAPPDGAGFLALVTPEPGSEEYDLIGQARQLVFIAEDVDAITRIRPTAPTPRSSSPSMTIALRELRAFLRS